MNNCSERLYNGIVKENPTFVLMLGMCPTLAVTHISCQRPWYGTFHNRGFTVFQYDYISTP